MKQGIIVSMYFCRVCK